MSPSSITALFAIIISVVSLYISAQVAWVSLFKPAELHCNFPHLVVWSLGVFKGDKPTGDVASMHITPSLWIANSGAKNILIEDVRLVFTTNDGKELPAYPMNKIPLEAIDSPSVFNEYQRFNLGGQFVGFSLSGSEGWKSQYSFILKKEYYQNLVGEIAVEVQVVECNKKGWHAIHKDVFNFGNSPIFLHDLKVGPGVVAGQRHSQFYSSKWIKRRQMKGL